MKKVRFGIVGVKGMGGFHAEAIVKSKSRDFRLGAVADVVGKVAEQVGRKLKVPYFTDAEAMYDSGLIDAVIVATPHCFHPPLSLAAARRGIHVLCEKPLAVTVGPARQMIAECRKRKVALGAMLQERTRAVMKKTRQMVDSGRIGEVFRISMICSDWYRTQAYYDSGAWRGTWDGEGGGILLNQAPHSLDLFQWIGGMPTSVVAVLDTRIHKIEVENTANAICRYAGGKIGYFYASTAHLPGQEQLIVCGDKGTLIVEGGKLRLGELNKPLSRDIFENPESGADFIINPRCTWKQVKVPSGRDGNHLTIMAAFARHILRGTPMVATGAEALNELEISNAMYLSGFNNSRLVDIPVSAAAAERLIARLIRERSSKKRRKKSGKKA